MCKKLVLLVLVLAFCLTSLSDAATIIWVSDNKNPTGGVAADQGWVDLLEANGYTVDLSFRNKEGQTLNAAKIAALNAADLIIVSRDGNSGDYDDGEEVTQWNAIETPIILTAAHIYRSSRWRWMDSTSTTNVTADLLAVLPDHPVFIGVALDANNQVNIMTSGDINVGDDNVDPANNYTLIATRSDAGADGVWIATWEPGVEFYPGSGQFAGGHRMYFAAGGGNPDGTYTLTAEGEMLFLNAVSYMLVESLGPSLARLPKPRNGAIVGLTEASPLGWTAGEGVVKHDVYFGADFDDVNDTDTTDTTGVYRGRQNLIIYTPPEALEFELGQTCYWRIDEVEADNTTIHKGRVWSFTVIDHILVEDFEDYNDFPPDEIFSTWPDGYEIDTNGALVGHDADFSKGEHFVETTIVHGGAQSMPYYYNNIGAATYSEAERTFSPVQDWTREGVKVLSLWFRGHPGYMGGFIEGPVGTYTMTADGADIWGNSDQFHFAHKEFSGAGSIIAKVESVENVHAWVKAGVMIRDTLDADSAHAMVAITPGNGVWFGRREMTGGSSSSDREAGITAPQWVKLERTIGGLVRSYYSADGITWTQLATPTSVTMDVPMYIGLALTSHNSGVVCEAVFSNVTSSGTGQWANEDVGMISNEAEPMYVTVEDGSSKAATVYHDDPNAALINTWTEWNIDLKEFADSGVVLTDVSKLSIGFGGADNPQPGGSGLVFFDDIRLYRPIPPEPEPAP